MWGLSYFNTTFKCLTRLRLEFLVRLELFRNHLKRRTARGVLLCLGICLAFVLLEMTLTGGLESHIGRSRTSVLIRLYWAFNLRTNFTRTDVDPMPQEGRSEDNYYYSQETDHPWPPAILVSNPQFLPTQRPEVPFYRLLTTGQSIRLPSKDIHIPTAVRYSDFPEKGAFNVFLNGWARHSTNQFVCCFLHSLRDNLNFRKPFEVKAVPYRVNADPASGLLNVEYFCSVSNNRIHSSGYYSGFNYLALSDTICSNPTADVIGIEYPEKIARSLGVCSTLPRKAPNPEFIVEWLEWHRLQGVTEMYVYHDHSLDKATKRVFDYYTAMEFVKLFNVPRPEQAGQGQSEFSDVMATNDCKHRMWQFDYVISVDFDEIVAPRERTLDIYHVLKNSSGYNPKAGVFQFHSFQVVLDWKPSKHSPLHLVRHQVHHAYINLGYDNLFTRWAFIPSRVSTASKQMAKPKEDYTLASIPPSKLVLLRFRKCPVQLSSGCLPTWMGVKDDIISRFEALLIVQMRQLPLEHILPYNLEYARIFDRIQIQWDWSYYGHRDNLWH